MHHGTPRSRGLRRPFSRIFVAVLLGAAHAGCFAMALSLILDQAGFAPDFPRRRVTGRPRLFVCR